MLHIVHALDIEHAGNTFNASENVLQLLAVPHIESDFDPCANIFSTTFKSPNVGARFADDASDGSEHSGPVFGDDAQSHREFSMRGAGPLDGDPPVGLVQQVFNVGAVLAVDGDPSAAGDVADDVVAGNRIAALGAIDHQVVVASHYDCGIIE